MKFVPYYDLAGPPNIIVDGLPTLGTVLTLSHWPGSGTPEALRDDLSAQIVFRFLATDSPLARVPAVSNGHFDKDGLVGIFALLSPELALGYRDLLVDVASAGDFGVYGHPDAARITFAISSYESGDRSPLAGVLSGRPGFERTALLYEELLPRMGEWLRDPAAVRRLWADEEAYLRDSEAALRRGEIRLEELPDLDLAVVTVPGERGAPGPSALPEYARAFCHPMAIHSATRMSRVLYRGRQRFEVQYRYETWVDYVSRRHAPRIDLAPLAGELSALEGPGVRWVFEGVAEITPRLRLETAEVSRLAPETFTTRVLDALRREAPRRGSG